MKYILTSSNNIYETEELDSFDCYTDQINLDYLQENEELVKESDDIEELLKLGGKLRHVRV